MESNRLGIFAFYEKNGIVEDYVVYLLKELRTSVKRLIFVCNGILSEEGRHCLDGVIDDIVMRENLGFDAGGFREVLLTFVEQNGLNDYEEIVLCNDTFFGPFVPFADIFGEMVSRKLDFWGLSAQPKSIDFWSGSDNVVPAFIQSFFIVIGKKMFSDKHFVSFWRNLEVDKWNRTQIVEKYEQRFTTYFENLGYRWGTYADNSFFEGTPEQNNFTPYLMMPYEMIRYGNCSFLKKKCITGKDIAQWMEPDNGSFAKALEYVDKNTNYDADLIREYMINNCSQDVIADKLKLSYILSDQGEDVEFDYSRLGIVVNMKDERQLNLVSAYLDGFSEQLMVYYVGGTDNPSIRDVLDHMPERAKFICVLQDYLDIGIGDGTDDSAYSLIARCIRLCDNLLYNGRYVASIINLFEQDEYLGVLYARGMHEEAGNIKLDILTSGWFKRDALEFHKDFYAGTICHEQYAANILSNTKELVGGITAEYRRKLFDFCDKQDKLYLYGTGGVAQRTAHALQKRGISFDGFIVSDGQNMERELMGYKVQFVSEVDLINAGVVISVEERLYKVISKVLDDRSFKNYTYSCY